ncbi:hypothetical protein NLI96_g10543 [Meripilus lineatus]|uniref:DUF1279 domain-containing protein n=1 Tax=Meripilus lineatus TaxID=2056292 RepID=A0AAD5Y975_9APHY|nr:hypothetical protein NLI96_g10543 [Physisporinus lineatus]
MVRNIILRIPVVRAIIPRVSRPLLPLTNQLSPTSLRRGRTPTRLFHTTPARLGSPSRRSPPPGPPPNASLSQRLKHLIKSYGWYALGVYTILAVADFAVAFAAVNLLGAEHVSRVATSIKDYFVEFFPSTPIEPGREHMDSIPPTAVGGNEGLYAMLVLAYTIHKTLFFPLRIGLTAAFTPRIVGWLRYRGWAGGEGAKRAVQEIKDKIRDRS